MHNYYNGSLMKALQIVYPQHLWQPLHFSVGKFRTVSSLGHSLFSKTQHLLFEYVQNILGGVDVQLNYRMPGRSMEFDVFAPELSLAIEYNGEYHYYSVPLYLVFYRV